MKKQTAPESLSELLKAWREKKGVSKAEAARRLNIPYRTLQDWELKNRTPRGFALRAIITRLKRDLAARKEKG